jgi:pimeloyl-ACP methyl ester carboxylesterase
MGRYRLILYHRRGYRDSGPVQATSIGQQAADCYALLRQLDVTRAHVVGHSLGGVIAIQLALEHPEAVHSLVLMEPALFGGTTGQAYRESLVQAERRYTEQPAEVIVSQFLEMRFGADYRSGLERRCPGAYEAAVVDSRTTFQVDLPALRAWEADERTIKQLRLPVLSVIGAESEHLSPRFGEVHRLLQEWLPQAESYVLPEAAHGLMMQNPAEMATALAAFLERHPIYR